MSRVSTLLRNSMLLFACLALFSCAGAQRYYQSVGLFEQRIINRPDQIIKRSWPNSDGTIVFPVHIFSNLLEADIMRPVCGEALTRPFHCTYVPLSWVGTFVYDKKKTNQLLPQAITFNKFGLIENQEIVVIIDRSKLDDVGTANLNKLMEKFFSVIKLTDDKETVQLFVQHVGAKQTEYQVLINLPNAGLLDAALADLRALPASTALPNEIIRKISSSAILSNDMTSCEQLKKTMPYDTISCYTPEQYQQFRDAKVARKFIVLNWDGETEVTPKMMHDIAPAKLQEICGQQSKDRTGLTGWQKFCHTALAQYYPDEPAPTWVIGAPTAEALHKLTDQVVNGNLHGGPYHLSFIDLSYIRTLAVGVYLESKELNYHRLVSQDKLEKAVNAALQDKIQILVTTQDWGAILQEAMKTSADPFTSPEALHKVNQANKADAVLLLWVRQISPEVNYTVRKNRITEPYAGYAEFTEAEPTEPPAPHKPDPDEREGGGRHYPGGVNDKWFIEDTKKYYGSLLPKYQNEQLPQYQKDHSKWEQNRAEWQQGKAKWQQGYDNYLVNYEFSVEETPKLEMTAYVKLIDQVAPSTASQRILWSHDTVLSRQTGTVKVIKTIPVHVIGEPATPPTPKETENYRNLFTWPDCINTVGDNIIYPLGQDALYDGLRTAVEELPEAALWVGDLKPWNKPDLQPLSPPPASPALTSPENGATNTKRTVRLEWQAVKDTQHYTVEVASNADFNDADTQSDLTAPHRVLSDLTPVTQYFWHVRATNDNGKSKWSETYTFTTEQKTETPVIPPKPIALTMLPPPIPIAPADKGITEAPKANFSWTPVEKAASYTVQMAENPTFTTPLVKEHLTATQCSVSDLKANVCYYWRILTESQDGKKSEWSAIYSFTTRDIPPAKPVILSKNGKLLIPLADFAKWLGATAVLKYDQKTGHSVLKFKDKLIILVLNGKTVSCDGETREIDQPMVEIHVNNKDTRFISVECLADLLGIDVQKSHNAKGYLLTINHPEADQPALILDSEIAKPF